MADNMSPCPVCERADLVRQDRIVDLAETLAGWEVATSARFPASLWARFRALGKTILYRCPACRFARFEPVAPSTPTSTRILPLDRERDSHSLLLSLS